MSTLVRACGCNCLLKSPWGSQLIRDKFKLKIARSVKAPWQEYGVVAGSQWWAPDFFSTKINRRLVFLFIITKNLDEENTDEGYSSNNVICHQWKTTIHSANDMSRNKSLWNFNNFLRLISLQNNGLWSLLSGSDKGRLNSQVRAAETTICKKLRFLSYILEGESNFYGLLAPASGLGSGIAGKQLITFYW